MTIQDRISEWHHETFPNCPNARILEKFMEEAGEFIETPVAEEAADVVIVLLGWASRNGIDLMRAVEKKFDIVKMRDQVLRDTERGVY